jgi:hypothetical protein
LLAGKEDSESFITIRANGGRGRVLDLYRVADLGRILDLDVSLLRLKRRFGHEPDGADKAESK